ncbi:hypothetical protein HMPREF3033_01039 [Veillonellaceae bacterium DNF00751]|nr:hypothetical protein HMPREF3033_01039 [Veillonellaceae bacterium DNF00751]
MPVHTCQRNPPKERRTKKRRHFHVSPQYCRYSLIQQKSHL